MNIEVGDSLPVQIVVIVEEADRSDTGTPVASPPSNHHAAAACAVEDRRHTVGGVPGQGTLLAVGGYPDRETDSADQEEAEQAL